MKAGILDYDKGIDGLDELPVAPIRILTDDESVYFEITYEHNSIRIRGSRGRLVIHPASANAINIMHEDF